MPKTSVNTSDSGIENDMIDANFRPLRIRVFKNGDERGYGLLMNVTRREFRHFLTFLDVLTFKLNTDNAVHRLFRVDGIAINQFEQLENNGCYVAVDKGPFLYRQYRGWKTSEVNKKVVRSWKTDPKIIAKEPGQLESSESVEIYLRKRGYQSRSGLPFPLDRLEAIKSDSDVGSRPSPLLHHLLRKDHSPNEKTPTPRMSGFDGIRRKSGEFVRFPPSQFPMPLTKPPKLTFGGRSGYSSTVSSVARRHQSRFNFEDVDLNGYEHKSS